eukprot:m.1465208 g.1465208  ORF g.1465208 m.1465208 type:complete len:1120 (+) comp25135_c0_seq29:202-3561(+)
MFGRLRKRTSSKDTLVKEAERETTEENSGINNGACISIDADDPNSAHSVPKFPMPSSPAKSNLKVLDDSGDDAALMTPSQRKYLTQEWMKLEAARSVCFGVNTIEEAVNIANSIWNDMALEYRPSIRQNRRRMGSGDLAKGVFSRRKRGVQFDPKIGVTRAEILDEMIKAPHGLLCEAVQPYTEPVSTDPAAVTNDVVTDTNGHLILDTNTFLRRQPLSNRASAGEPDKGYLSSVLRGPGKVLTFDTGDLVLALRPLPGTDPTDPSPWMDGIANGVRGRFPGNCVKKAEQQQRDVMFMWMNQPPPAAGGAVGTSTAVALTHDVGAAGHAAHGSTAHDDDDYIEHGGDDSDEASDGSSSSDDFEESDFDDANVFPYGGAAVGVQDVELWDEIDGADDDGVATMVAEDGLDLEPIAASDVVHGCTDTPQDQPPNTDASTATSTGSTNIVANTDSANDASGAGNNSASLLLDVVATAGSRERTALRPSSVVDYITVVQGTGPLPAAPAAAFQTDTPGASPAAAGTSPGPQCAGEAAMGREQHEEQGEYIVTGDDLDGEAEGNPYPDLNLLRGASGRRSPDPPRAGPTRSKTQRGKRWGRKPLASPPPMRRVRSLPLSPPEFQRMPKTARGFIRRSFRRQSSQKKNPPPSSGADVEERAESMSTQDNASTRHRHSDTHAASGRAWHRTLQLRESMTQHHGGQPDAPRDHHAYSDRAFKFLQQCTTALERRDASRTKGLYCDSTGTSAAAKLFNSFMHSSALPRDDFSEHPVSTLTAAVQLVFQQAESALLVPVDDWLTAVRETEAQSAERAGFLLTCLELLPWTHRVMAVVLMEHLVSVAAASAVNDMTALSIGEVFGPILLRVDRAGTADTPCGGTATARDTATASAVVAALIEQFADIFIHDSASHQPAAGSKAKKGAAVVLRSVQEHGPRTQSAAGERQSILFDAQGNVVRCDTGADADTAPVAPSGAMAATSSSDPRRTSVYEGFGELLDVSEDGPIGSPEHMVDLYDSDHAGAYDGYMAIGAVPEEDAAGEATPTTTTPIGTLTRHGGSELTGQHLARRASQESAHGFAGLDTSDCSSDDDAAEMEWREDAGAGLVRGSHGSVYGFDVPSTATRGGGC